MVHQVAALQAAKSNPESQIQPHENRDRRVTMAASTASMDGEAKVSPLMAAVRSPGTQPSHGDFLVQINDFKQLDFK